MFSVRKPQNGEVTALKKTVCGLNINYICKGEGETILVLHGWGSNVGVHAAMIDLLAEKYRVIAPDMPGFGESEEPDEPWFVDNYVDFILEFLKDFDVSKLTLVGHSFGGRVIIKLCARKEELPFEIEKVILVDAAGVKPETSPEQKFKQAVYRKTKWVFSTALVKKLCPDLLDNLRKKNGSADYNAASDTMKKTLVNVVNEDLTELMPSVTCPTLLIWGRLDTATPLSDGQTMEKLMPESALVILENAGHFSFLDQSAQFLRIIASFMNI